MIRNSARDSEAGNIKFLICTCIESNLISAWLYLLHVAIGGIK